MKTYKQIKQDSLAYAQSIMSAEQPDFAVIDRETLAKLEKEEQLVRRRATYQRLLEKQDDQYE